MTPPRPTRRPGWRLQPPPPRRAPLLCLAAALAGCCTCPPPPPPPHAYGGDTVPLDQVVAHANANAGRVPSIWSQLDYTADLVDPVTHAHTIASGDGLLMYRRPASLRLTGNKDVAGTVFDLGVNDDTFFVKLRRSIDAGEFYTGRLANVGKPCCKPVPIRPDLLVDVLAVGLLQTNLLAQPVPVMRFDNEQDAYVLDFNVRRADRWVTARQVWYDRATFRPRRVTLYDDRGRAVIRAALSRHEPVDLPDVPPDRRPVVARRYDLLFPDTGSVMSLTLDAPEVTHRGRRATLPNDRSFTADPDPHDRLIQVDANCPDAAPAPAIQ